MQCNTTITKQSHDITTLTRDVGLLEHKMALTQRRDKKVIQGSRKEGQNKAELTAVLVLFKYVQWLYGEHPASKFKSLLELPNDLGLDNIANQSKT